MTGLSVSQQSISEPNGLRPINLRTDLAQLADLIELVFSDTMDASGRAAIREMRYLSRMGIGLSVLSSMGELGHGLNMGYVWVEDERLVGNVSVYRANWPSVMGSAWIIANVAVHPDYQRRGIARQLMRACMTMIRDNGGRLAILQVDEHNRNARNLYESLGFFNERTWTQWYRNDAYRPPPAMDLDGVHIARRGRNEWHSEYRLAQQVRPYEQGGLGWLRPLHPTLFRDAWWKKVFGWLSLTRTERLVIRDPQDSVAASLWIDTKLGGTRTQLTLMTAPEYQGLYDEYLLYLATRRYGGRSTLICDHPADEEAANAFFRRYHFRPRRTVVNMRWDMI